MNKKQLGICKKFIVKRIAKAIAAEIPMAEKAEVLSGVDQEGGLRPNQQQEPGLALPTRYSQSRIERGIEWYTVDAGPLEQDLTEDNQCARCGSSVAFNDCWNCEDGYIEVDIGDDCCEEIVLHPCDICEGRGGRWHCISTPEYCEAHPIPEREGIESTALKSGDWNDS